MRMPGRVWDGIGYRFGFNGQEKDDETLGIGNSYTAEFWEYDTRTGRRWNKDPVIKPFESPYVTFADNPILNRDPDGANPNPVTPSQALDAIKYAASIVRRLANAKKLNAPISEVLRKEIRAFTQEYAKNHKGVDIKALEAVTENYLIGLKDMAWWSLVSFNKLDRTVISNNIGRISDLKKVAIVEAGIVDNRQGMHQILGEGANVAMFITFSALFPEVGAQPKGPQINSTTQQQIVDAGANKEVSRTFSTTPNQPALVPAKANDVVRYAEQNQGAAMPGYKGGRQFLNDGRGGGEILPTTDANGNAITYKEYDVNPFKIGTNRGDERVVIGSNGKAYYTNNHYRSFSSIN